MPGSSACAVEDDASPRPMAACWGRPASSSVAAPRSSLSMTMGSAELAPRAEVGIEKIRFTFLVGDSYGRQCDPDAHTCHSTSHLHPPPGPWPRGCAPLTPTCSYTPIHTMPITPEKLQPKTCGRSTLLADTGPRNMHDGGGCDYGCGLGTDTDANDAVGGWWARKGTGYGKSCNGCPKS